MKIDPETAKQVGEHLRDLKLTCPYCGGNSSVIENALAMVGVATPLTEPIKPAGTTMIFFPIMCENCGFTALFHAPTVVKKVD